MRPIPEKDQIQNVAEKGSSVTLEWTCHICGAVRPDEFISVRSTDVSKSHGLKPGAMLMNVRYCNDNPSCIEKSKSKNLLK